jgi:hypothetical protein
MVYAVRRDLAKAPQQLTITVKAVIEHEIAPIQWQVEASHGTHSIHLYPVKHLGFEVLLQKARFKRQFQSQI